jgi:hypothetical protein
MHLYLSCRLYLVGRGSIREDLRAIDEFRVVWSGHDARLITMSMLVRILVQDLRLLVATLSMHLLMLLIVGWVLLVLLRQRLVALILLVWVASEVLLLIGLFVALLVEVAPHFLTRLVIRQRALVAVIVAVLVLSAV